MKYKKIIGLGAICFVIVFAIAILITISLEDIIGDQQERNYKRFVTNVDGLTNTFRQPVEECVANMEFENNVCIKETIAEYQIQFSTLIKLFGYENYIDELYQYWEADLRYWHEVKKLETELAENPELQNQEIQRLEKIRQDNINARLDASFAEKIESGQ